MSNLAMIPARMGSQRLQRKNLQPLHGEPLIVHAIRKCRTAGVFDEVWVNSEHPDFEAVAHAEGARFHRRPEHLGGPGATSEQFVAEFLGRHDCERLFQVHSIAPLLTARDVVGFVEAMAEGGFDAMMSVVDEPLEAVFEGSPVNFSFTRKTNSQELRPVRRITWAITGWRRATYLDAVRAGVCATYAGRIGYVPVDRLAGHVIKTAADLAVAEVLYPLVHGPSSDAP